MGSWHGTCAISKTAILAGDRVVVVPMLRHPSPIGRTDEDGGCVCGVQVDWHPLHVPLRGSYNDYGAAELDDNPDTRLFASYYTGDPLIDPRKFLVNHRVADEVKDSCTKDEIPVRVAPKPEWRAAIFHEAAPFYVEGLYPDGRWDDYGNLLAVFEFYRRQ